jgi:hypothetical protein
MAKPGRPPIVQGEDTEVLHVRVADTDHDGVCQLSLRWTRDRDRHVSKLDVVREAIKRLLASELAASGSVSKNS